MNKTMANRMSGIYFVFLFLSLGILARILYLQLFTDLAVSAEKIAYTKEEVEANRGDILACDGRVLASSVPYYQIRMDCVVPQDSIFERDIASLSVRLSAFFGNKSATAYENEIRQARGKGNRYKQLGNRSIEHYELNTVKAFPLFCLGPNRGGLIVVPRYKRKKPYDRLALRTIGYVNRKGAGVGIEAAYDYFLKGRPGEQMLQRLPGGEWVPLSSEPMVFPVDGYDVVSTLDIDIQEAAEIALREQLDRDEVFEGGTAVVMEVSTGAVRAIVNMKRSKDGSFDESYNYAIAESTNPGSTFKLATLIALIEDNLAHLDDSIATGNGHWRYGGHTFSDVHSGGYGTISLKEAFEKSSNVGFAKTAVEKYENDPKKFINRLYDMKLNEHFNIELMGEGRADIHYPGDLYWSKLSLPMMAIGYELLLTPMHTLTFYNAIANDGKMVKPYFIESLQKYGKTVKVFRHEVISNAICSPSTVAHAREALQGVVKRGTAKSVFKDAPYTVSGKTGTAQIAFNGVYRDKNGYRKHQASFAGFFPSDHPKYSMIVVLYTGKTRDNFYGGAWAAPVFRKIADRIYINSPYWFPALDARQVESPLLARAEKAYAQNRQTLQENIDRRDSLLPSVLGMHLPDALYLLENKGLQVDFTGSGKVVGQDPEPGTSLNASKRVSLTLTKTAR